MGETEKVVLTGRVPIWTALTTSAALLVYAVPWLPPLLVFDRTAIFTGEIWRIVTGNWVHFSLTHLTYDLLTLSVAGYTVERLRCHGVPWVIGLSSLMIGLGLLIFDRDMERYGGLSGIACGVVVYLALFGLKNPQWRAFAAATLIGVAAKILWEIKTQGVAFAVPDATPLVSVPLSHLTGAVTAVVVFLVPVPARSRPWHVHG